MILLDGKNLANKITNKLKLANKNLMELNAFPKLAILLVGNDPASILYTKMKKEQSEKIGNKCDIYSFDETVDESIIINKINELNNDCSINGILIQLPLPINYDENKIIEKISPIKDVDGLTSKSLGNIVKGDTDSLCVPCTPLGIIKLLQEYNIQIESKNAVVIGRSNIVGKPISLLLLKQNANITICHSKTKNLKEHTQKADIIIIGIGKPNFLTKEYIKEGVVIIDVGINRIKDNTKKSGHKIVGDADFENIKNKVSAITPVPGGVGPMTIAMLTMNTIKLCIKQKFEN